MKIIDLLNKIANGVTYTKKARIRYFDRRNDYEDECILNEVAIGYRLYNQNIELNDEVEILEEEKKIPEKHINNYGDLIILGQQDNWLEPTIETDQKINAQLNPYVFEAINENFKDIENKIYEIIDYLKSKGDE